MIYVDIDGTICTNELRGEYHNAEPYMDRIKEINGLYDNGCTVVYWTARGTETGQDWLEYTRTQLRLWGAKYTDLMVGKPFYDLWIDDKSVEPKEWFHESNNNR